MKDRKSNIELLRILAMLGVIILHINNPQIGGGIAFANSINKIFIYFFESIFIVAVNLFILISGYFLIDTNKRNIWKVLELLIQVITYKKLFI